MNAPIIPVTTVLLGEVVAWDMNPKNLPGGLVTYHDMQQALRDAGLDPDAAKEMKPRAAFSRACKDLKKDRSIDKLKQAKGSSSCSFQFTKKLVEDAKINFDYECQVHLDTDSGAITCPEQPALEAEATALFAHARQMRNAQDVTRLVQKLFTDNASLFPLVPNKGVAYFVPEVHREFTAKVEAGSLLWSADAKEAYHEIHRSAKREGICPGDRRLRKSVRAAQAFAWLNEADEVTPDHLEILSHTLWDDPAEQPRKLAQIVGQIANPVGLKVNSLLFECEQVVAGANLKELTVAATVVKKLAEIEKQLKGVDGAKAKQASDYIKGKIRDIKVQTAASM